MRLFIAIDLPLPVKEKIKLIQEELKACGLKVRWVNPRNIHLTLKFLGGTPEEKIPAITEALNNTASKFRAFDLPLKGFGFFPNARRPRVLFVNTGKEMLLTAVYRELEKQLKKEGFTQENHFKAHITLARLKKNTCLDDFERKVKEMYLKEVFRVDFITLYKSTLTQKSPIYEIIAKSALAA